MRIEAGSNPSAGGARFRITDAVALRVPIVPNPNAPVEGERALERQRKAAATTDLALYTLSVGDFRIPRRQLDPLRFVEPPGDRTLATLTIVPTRERGFSKGDVARHEELRYETTTTFASLSLIVATAEDPGMAASTDIVGRVRVRELDERRICLDISVEVENSDELVAALEGTISAPVVRAREGFYFT